MTTFTLDDARALLPDARHRITELAATVARARELVEVVGQGSPPPGTVAEAKAAEASADDQLGWFHRQGIQVKGIAPALLDFPARAVRGGAPVHVLLCWREGEGDITTFHPPESGYLGREPLDVLDEV